MLIFAYILSDLSKGQFKNGDFDNSRMAKKKSLDLSKWQPNYTITQYPFTGIKVLLRAEVRYYKRLEYTFEMLLTK